MAYALARYRGLLEALLASGYALGPVESWFEGATPPRVFLRHDVDRLPARACAMAECERELGARATYYFRCDRRGAFPADAVRRVAELGHEVGFHYETVARAGGDADRALAAFERELAALRALGVGVRTVAAHGSPLSAHANQGLADRRALERLGLLGEPGEHMDFTRVLYVTDTGGVYGSPHNLRDRVAGRNWTEPTPPDELGRRLDPAREPLVLLSSHPERWPSGAAAVLVQRGVDGLANALKQWVRR